MSNSFSQKWTKMQTLDIYASSPSVFPKSSIVMYTCIHVLYLYSLTNKGEPPTLSQLPIATKTLIYNSLYSLNLNNNNIAPKIDILILTLCITIT